MTGYTRYEILFVSKANCPDDYNKNLHLCIIMTIVHDVKRELQECDTLARENVTQIKKRKIA
jgi:hypothetical protein